MRKVAIYTNNERREIQVPNMSKMNNPERLQLARKLARENNIEYAYSIYKEIKR